MTLAQCLAIANASRGVGPDEAIAAAMVIGYALGKGWTVNSSLEIAGILSTITMPSTYPAFVKPEQR